MCIECVNGDQVLGYVVVEHIIFRVFNDGKYPGEPVVYGLWTEAGEVGKFCGCELNSSSVVIQTCLGLEVVCLFLGGDELLK